VLIALYRIYNAYLLGILTERKTLDTTAEVAAPPPSTEAAAAAAAAVAATEGAVKSP